MPTVATVDDFQAQFAVRGQGPAHIGIVLDYNIGRFVADAEALYSYEGTREINTMIVGRAVTGLSAFV